MNIVIPAAGKGSRFAACPEFHGVPKPFIQLGDYCMLERVVQNCKRIGDWQHGDSLYIIARQEHMGWLHDSGIDKRHDAYWVFQDGDVNGAVDSIMFAESAIDSSEPLLIANSDQLVRINRPITELGHYDASILTFRSSEEKWSYVRCGEGSDEVLEVAEKKVISEDATCGIYYFRRGSDFIEGALKMMAADDRVNGEFYTCPVFNHLIESNRTSPRRYSVLRRPVGYMWGLGTPEDYAANYLSAINLQYSHRHEDLMSP